MMIHHMLSPSKRLQRQLIRNLQKFGCWVFGVCRSFAGVLSLAPLTLYAAAEKRSHKNLPHRKKAPIIRRVSIRQLILPMRNLTGRIILCFGGTKLHITHYTKRCIEVRSYIYLTYWNLVHSLRCKLDLLSNSGLIKGVFFFAII